MQTEKISYKEAKAKWKQENQFDLLSNFEEEFPDIGEQGHSHKNSNSGQYKFVWKKTNRAQQKLTSGAKQMTYAEKVKEKQYQPQFTENSHKSSLLERTIMELKHFWRNLNLVRKLMRLQTAINVEVVGQAASEINLEEILIKTSSTLDEIIQEFTEDLAEYVESPSKETDEPNTPIDG